jgi:hypothetical protein
MHAREASSFPGLLSGTTSGKSTLIARDGGGSLE